MRSRIIVFSIVAALSNAAVAGDIYRCVAANGDVMFTNLACPATSQVQHVASYEPVPDSPVPKYDASAEAAAISAEQARDAARQAQMAAYEAQAAYEQAQADAQRERAAGEAGYASMWIPYYVPVGSRRHDHNDHHDHRRHERAPATFESAMHRPAAPTPHNQPTMFARQR